MLIIGWRGSPKVKDEPQHNVKGKITLNILKLLNIKYTIIRKNSDLIKFNKQIKKAKIKKEIVACLIEQGTLKKNNYKVKKKDFYNLDKEFFLKSFLESVKKKSKIISSTGYNSRELMYVRNKYKFKNSNDFYMVGGMGHTISVGLGYSLFSNKKTICIDGDGSILMHLGSLKTAGTFASSNFKYILLKNLIKRIAWDLYTNTTHNQILNDAYTLLKTSLKLLLHAILFQGRFSVNNEDTGVLYTLKNFLGMLCVHYGDEFHTFLLTETAFIVTSLIMAMKRTPPTGRRTPRKR